MEETWFLSLQASLMRIISDHFIQEKDILIQISDIIRCNYAIFWQKFLCNTVNEWGSYLENVTNYCMVWSSFICKLAVSAFRPISVEYKFLYNELRYLLETSHCAFLYTYIDWYFPIFHGKILLWRKLKDEVFFTQPLVIIPNGLTPPWSWHYWPATISFDNDMM